MKKKLFSLMTIAMMALVCVGLTACGSDDDDNNNGSGGGSAVVTESSLYGIWKDHHSVNISYYKSNDGEWKEGSRHTYYYNEVTSSGFLFEEGGKAKNLIMLNADGTYRPDAYYEYNYKVENGRLYVMKIGEGETGTWEDYGKIQITGNTMETVFEEYVSDIKKKETIRGFVKLK